MEKTKRFTLLVVVSVAFLLSATPCSYAALTNGDFSDDPPGVPWTFVLDNIEVTSDSTALDGNGKVVLRPDDEGVESWSTISQENIFLLPGENVLSFDLTMERSQVGHETDAFSATFGGNTFYTLLSSSIGFDLLYSETVLLDVSGWAPGPYVLVFELYNDPDWIFYKGHHR